MYRLMLLTAGALVALASAAQSQTVRSGSQSGAQAIAIIDGYGAGAPAGGTTRNRVINNPDLGSFATVPTAPCIVPTGGSGSGGGIGLSLLFGLSDDECKKMRQVEMARVLGGGNSEQGLYEGGEMACRLFEEYRAMRASVGRPCVADIPAGTPPVASVALTQAPRTKPDWCYTRDRSVLARPECQG